MVNIVNETSSYMAKLLANDSDACTTQSIDRSFLSFSGKDFRGRSLFISWGGGGGGWAILGGHEKNLSQMWGGGSNKISFMNPWGVGGRVTNMISISFSGIKMLWLLS